VLGDVLIYFIISDSFFSSVASGQYNWLLTQISIYLTAFIISSRRFLLLLAAVVLFVMRPGHPC
jgi:hypothetical protein